MADGLIQRVMQARDGWNLDYHLPTWGKQISEVTEKCNVVLDMLKNVEEYDDVSGFVQFQVRCISQLDRNAWQSFDHFSGFRHGSRIDVQSQYRHSILGEVACECATATAHLDNFSSDVRCYLGINPVRVGVRLTKFT